MERVIYPGTFDPPTNGHLNIMRRACRIFDEVHIVVANNPAKSTLFTIDERVGVMRSLAEGFTNIIVHRWDGLIVEIAKELGVRVIVRGVRALSDFNYEFELSLMNRALNSEIETIFMPTDQKYFVLRSSAIKDLAQLGGDVSAMVPPVVAELLHKKLGGGSTPSADVSD